MRCKGGSFLFTRCHGDLAAVSGHDSFGNEKPEVEPGLLVLALDRILILTARHRVENGGDGVGGNSALGMNGKDYFATRAFRRNVNRKGPRSVQDRIADQVRQNLPDAGAVPIPFKVAGRFDRDSPVGVRCLGFLCGLLDSGSYIHRSGRNRQVLEETDADGINQVGNEPVDEGGAGFDLGHQAGLLVVKLASRYQRLGRVVYYRERIAEIVNKRPDEQASGTSEFLGETAKGFS